jgi:Fe-S-cluster-containing dehydrogenase component
MLSFNLKRCVLCFGCEVACKIEHNRSGGPKWIEVITVGPEEAGGKMAMEFVPMSCRHCEDPPCMAVCPSKGAIHQREDGIVLLNSELCIGCRFCIQACPFGAMQFNADRGVVEKCDLCVDRVDQGLEPFCAKNCFGKCIEFKTVEDLSKDRRAAIARNILVGR